MKSLILIVLLLSGCSKSEKVTLDIKNMYKEPICKDSLRVKEINSIIILGDFVLDPTNNFLTKDELIKKFNKELTDRNTKIETLCTFSNYVHELEGLDQSILNLGIVPNKLTGAKWDDQLKLAESTFNLAKSLQKIDKANPDSLKKFKFKPYTLEQTKALNELYKSVEKIPK